MEQPAGLGHGVVVEEDHDRPAGVADAGVARTRQAAALLVRDHPDRRAPLGAGPAEEVLIMIDHENHLERRRRLPQHRPDGLAQDRPAPFGVGADDDGRRRRRFSGGGIVGGRCHDGRSIAACFRRSRVEVAHPNGGCAGPGPDASDPPEPPGRCRRAASARSAAPAFGGLRFGPAPHRGRLAQHPLSLLGVDGRSRPRPGRIRRRRGGRGRFHAGRVKNALFHYSRD